MFKCEWLMQNNMTFTHVCCRSTNNQQKVRKRHDQKICFQGMSLQLITWKRKCIGKVRIWRNSMTHSKMQPPIFLCVCGFEMAFYFHISNSCSTQSTWEREKRKKHCHTTTANESKTCRSESIEKWWNSNANQNVNYSQSSFAMFPGRSKRAPILFNDINDWIASIRQVHEHRIEKSPHHQHHKTTKAAAAGAIR